MSEVERATRLFYEALDCADAGDYAGAETKLRDVLRVLPEKLSVLVNLATVLLHQHEIDESFRFATKAIGVDRDDPDAWLVLASCQWEQSKWPEALASFDRVIALKPDNATAWAGRGQTLFQMHQWAETAAAYASALKFDPGYKYLKGEQVHAKMRACDWRDLQADRAGIIRDVEASLPVTRPFPLLALTASAADQLKCARLLAADEFPPSDTPLWKGESYSHDRIRLGYISPDFRAHPVAYLIAGLFERHDRERFETIGISLGEDEGGAMRARLSAGLDKFIDMHGRKDVDIAQAIRAMEVDILVDLGGFTQKAGTKVLARRPAPVQVNYLGYPGTMGADYIDYIIADRFVIPDASQAHYAEKVVRLPDSFQVNDDHRPLPGAPPARASATLPETGFVFCCLNNSYKVNPDIFGIWMRLLAQTPGSVLWLLADDPSVGARLRDEAEQRGIDGERLIFAARRSYADHLTRLQLADVFLDTLPFNGGATASDALWAGVPVVTCAGEAFASRMAGSLLNAVGLPELVTDAAAEYEALALRLASTPAMLADIRARLVRGRTTRPLFDTGRFCRHIESAYTSMWERCRRGLAPASFSVESMMQRSN